MAIMRHQYAFATSTLSLSVAFCGLVAATATQPSHAGGGNAHAPLSDVNKASAVMITAQGLTEVREDVEKGKSIVMINAGGTAAVMDEASVNSNAASIHTVRRRPKNTEPSPPLLNSTAGNWYGKLAREGGSRAHLGGEVPGFSSQLSPAGDLINRYLNRFVLGAGPSQSAMIKATLVGSLLGVFVVIIVAFTVYTKMTHTWQNTQKQQTMTEQQSLAQTRYESSLDSAED